MGKQTLLIVEDDLMARAMLVRVAKQLDNDVVEAGTCADAHALLAKRSFDAIITDVHLPDGEGFEIIDDARDSQPGCPVIVMTGDDDLNNGIHALQRGVVDFLRKPFEPEVFVRALDRTTTSMRPPRPGATDQTGTFERSSLLPDELGTATAASDSAELALSKLDSWQQRYAPALLGSYPKLLQVFWTLERVCDTDCSVLITGESGTGKELVARAVHAASDRSNGPFIAVNCAAIPEQLVESELFGHARGAFTGAVAPRTGRFAAADGGTLFLDEIGELPLSQQAKLLRAIQEREIVPVGESRPRKVNVRIVAATHRNLEDMVAQGTFRGDLLYRIEVVPVHLPSLRERRGDIPALVSRFIDQFNERRNRSVTGIQPQVLEALCNYAWPGNVRQLENVIERMVLLQSSGVLGVETLPARIAEQLPADAVAQAAELPEEGIDLRDAVEQYENRLILQALERTGWNKNQAAAVLRMNRTTLVEKLKKKQLGDTHAA